MKTSDKKPAVKKKPKPKPKPAAAKKTTAKPAPARRTVAARTDYGKPVDGWFARQPQPQRGIVARLRALVHEAAPDAVGSLKWGMPFYSAGGVMCAISSFKSHVNLILSGPPGSYADPDGLLEGDGKTGRHLRLRTLDELPVKEVKAWLKTAAALARKRGAGM